jgi:methyl-accepting chemotaxis protein
MTKIKFNLANQILAGYSVIILVAVVASLFCITSLRGNQVIDKRITEVNLPFFLTLKELNTLTGEMNKLTNSWIYQPNPAEKKILVGLFEQTYPSLSKKLSALVDASDEGSSDSVRTATSSLSQIVDSEIKVTQLLSVDSLYSNDVIVDEAIQLMDKTIAPQTAQLSKLLQRIIDSQEQKIAQAQKEKEKSYSTLTFLLVFMVVAFIATTLAAYLNVRKRIVRPIVSIKDSLVDLGRGKIVKMDAGGRDDEVGQMHNAMVNLTNGINAKSIFADQIGNGKYEERFDLLSEDDSMGKALLAMRDNLKKNAEEERKRNWAVAGLAKFGEMLRNQDQDIEKFGDQVLSFTIKYINANQGRLFVVNDDVKEQMFLQLISCYAWDKKKFLEQKIELGEGLTGQCWQEGEPIYITKVPDDYVKITSGLGIANPSNVFIVPLKVNESTFGVLEMASFKLFENYEREFILKLSENLAAAISTVRINQKTKNLLAQTQQQAEEMRSQEEEMRQNMEELSATQEEMSRKEKGYLEKIAELEKNHR